MSDEKNVTRGQVTYSYSTAWTTKLEDEQHWRLYWQQQKLMEPYVARGDDFLEIGHGSGFTANYLRHRGYEVTTVDIDADKRPDIVSNLPDFEPSETVDHVLAFEVFEHVPFDDVERFVARMSGWCRKAFFVSVPELARVMLRLEDRLPKVGPIYWRIKRRGRGQKSAHHFWELGDGTINEPRFIDLFEQNGFELAEHIDKFTRHFFAFVRRGDETSASGR